MDKTPHAATFHRGQESGEVLAATNPKATYGTSHCGVTERGRPLISTIDDLVHPHVILILWPWTSAVNHDPVLPSCYLLAHDMGQAAHFIANINATRTKTITRNPTTGGGRHWPGRRMPPFKRARYVDGCAIRE